MMMKRGMMKDQSNKGTEMLSRERRLLQIRPIRWSYRTVGEDALVSVRMCEVLGKIINNRHCGVCHVRLQKVQG